MSASNTIDPYVPNFVSVVKLSGKENYHLWKAQMLCLLKSVNVYGILDDTFVGRAETATQYENLVRGWIFGSVSEVVLEEVYNLDSAKAVWEKLQSNYDASLQEDLAIKEADAKPEKEETEAVLAETNTIEEGAISIEMETTNEDSENQTKRKKKLKKLKSLIIKGDWPELRFMLKEDISLAIAAINSDGSTILHIAVGMRRNHIVKNLLFYEMVMPFLPSLFKKRDSDGSTALHIAAIVGNKEAAQLMLKRRQFLRLLDIKDNKGDLPLHKAYENMHLATIAYLLKATTKAVNYGIIPSATLSIDDGDETPFINLIVNAVSAKQYGLASKFFRMYPKAVSRSDEVLMALAKTFPSELDDGETLLYPSLKHILDKLRKTALVTIYLFLFPATMLLRMVTGFRDELKNDDDFGDKILSIIAIFILTILTLFSVPICMVASALAFTCLLMLIVCFPFFFLYFIVWKGAKILAFPAIKRIENKIMEKEDAKKFLVLVCDEIDKMNYEGTPHPSYTRPILEAASQNAYTIVDEILSRSPEAIHSKDKSGYDNIQLAIINRSKKIYNLIYDVDERKNLHKTYKDSSKNNILHLAGRLAPSSVLNQRTGAALQLPRELQWYEEVKKLVIPTCITQENILKETPDMVFTREHKNLVKEGEQWMKTTSESCSITAALITTIVFAAAITLPGGNNQEKGTPLFQKDIVFIIFAISDAISLFASSTSLLVFLSILTARFAEKDFLVSLPRRLFIGLFSLLLSTTSMMVAFSATVFLVFCDKKLWTLAPICGLAFIPIAFFVGLQFLLMVDLFSSTYLPIFGKERAGSLKYLIRKALGEMFVFVKIYY